MRFHVVSLPHTHTITEFLSCAYTTKVRYFCEMMKKRGHEVFLYSGDENTAICTQHIPCISEENRKKLVGKNKYNNMKFDYEGDIWRSFNFSVISEIHKRIEPKDFICIITGYASKMIADAFPNHMSVEFGIGYGGHFAKYKVWESYAWMHTCYSTHQPNPHDINGFAYDTVIPNYINLGDFDFQKKKKDYFLYLGRLEARKGIILAQQMCQMAKVPLIIAGTGDSPIFYGTAVGEVGMDKRRELLAGARALLAPTQYIEPFGTAAIEALASGTPVICSDWGAFTETVPAKVGYRCRLFQDYLDAIEGIDKIDRAECVKEAQQYSLNNIAPRYEKYFNDLMTLWDVGYYKLRETA